MPFTIVRNDITKMQVDAIVNTANAFPTYGEGTDTAVYMAAGVEALLAERKKIGYMEEGEVAITSGFQLPAKYIIHAVSPCYTDGESGEEEKLRACYQKSLKLASEHGCMSIAFPLIATGSFRYPKEEGMRIALDEIHTFLLKEDMQIYLVVFDEQSTKLGKQLYPDLQEYIDQNYVGTETKYSSFSDSFRRVRREASESERIVPPVPACFSMSVPAPVQADTTDEDVAYEDFLEESASAIQERIQHLSDTFQEYLLYLIQHKGLTNTEVYKNAIITKQLFSKIKMNPDYHPDKSTAMRLCVGAKLNMDETRDLLARAGYALSPCDKRDIIFSYFIEREVYDMIEIDIVLEEYGLPCFIE